MPRYMVEANCPITDYEGDSADDAIEKYSENFNVNYKFLTATEIEDAPQNVEAVENNA